MCRRSEEIFRETVSDVDDDANDARGGGLYPHCAACEFDMFASLITDTGDGGGSRDRNTHISVFLYDLSFTASHAHTRALYCLPHSTTDSTSLHRRAARATT